MVSSGIRAANTSSGASRRQKIVGHGSVPTWDSTMVAAKPSKMPPTLW